MPTLTSVTVSPPSLFILITETQQYFATAHFSDAVDLDITSNPSTTWSSSDGYVATIDSTGLATALSISGATTITATYNLQLGTAILQVGAAGHTRILEQLVDPTKITETSLTAPHNPIVRLTTPNISSFTGAVVFRNINRTLSDSRNIGYSFVSGHPGDFTRDYIATGGHTYGNWVQINSSGFVTKTFNVTQRDLGIVASICINNGGAQLGSFPHPISGVPVLVQISGDGYVSTTDATIALGSFLGPGVSGKVVRVPFDPEAPTPIIGFALEGFSNTYQNMVLMRIQICGE